MFPPEFLRIVLTAIADAAVEERLDPFWRALLGDGDQSHRICGATYSPRRIGDSARYCVKIVPDSFHVHEATFVSPFSAEPIPSFVPKLAAHKKSAGPTLPIQAGLL
jgi:hypothetical protein